MNKISRSENITRNVSVTIVTQAISMVFAFLTRTIFIRLLGEEYLGVDGLFTSILTIFSLAELGIGNALIFSLYKPIAQGDTQKATQYLAIYEKCYRWIIFIILAIGVVIIPFLQSIVNADIDHLNINLYVVYCLFLFNTVSSYFLAHRQAVLVVNQLQRTVSSCQTVVKIIVSALECTVLLLFKSYYLYLLIRVIGNYSTAIWLNFKVKKSYPELCVINKEKLSKEEIFRIKKDVYALFIRRTGSVIASSSAGIIINAFISLSMVGIYSNYVLIVNSVQGVTTLIVSAMTASIGNFIATKKKNESESAFRLYTFISYLLYGFCTIFFIVLVDRFIVLLWGENYVLSKTALYLIVLNFFLYGFQSAINVFRDTSGLFVQGKYRPLISAAVSLGLSLILAPIMGIEGIILGSIASRVLISVWYDPFILYKKLFQIKVSGYFYRLISYLFTSFALGFLISTFTKLLPNTIVGILLSAVVCCVCSLALLLPFLKSIEFKDLFSRIRQMLPHKIVM